MQWNKEGDDYEEDKLILFLSFYTNSFFRSLCFKLLFSEYIFLNKHMERNEVHLYLNQKKMAEKFEKYSFMK